MKAERAKRVARKVSGEIRFRAARRKVVMATGKSGEGGVFGEKDFVSPTRRGFCGGGEGGGGRGRWGRDGDTCMGCRCICIACVCVFVWMDGGLEGWL